MPDNEPPVDEREDEASNFVKKVVGTLLHPDEVVSVAFAWLLRLFRKQPQTFSALLFVAIVVIIGARLSGVDVLFFVPTGSFLERSPLVNALPRSTWISNDARIARCTQIAESEGARYVTLSVTQYVQYGYEPVLIPSARAYRPFSRLLVRERIIYELLPLRQISPSEGTFTEEYSQSRDAGRITNWRGPFKEGRSSEQPSYAVYFAGTIGQVVDIETGINYDYSLPFQSGRHAFSDNDIGPIEADEDFWNYASEGSDFVCQVTQIIEAPFLHIEKTATNRGIDKNYPTTTALKPYLSSDNIKGSTIISTWNDVAGNEKVGIVFKIDELEKYYQQLTVDTKREP